MLCSKGTTSTRICHLLCKAAPIHVKDLCVTDFRVSKLFGLLCTYGYTCICTVFCTQIYIYIYMYIYAHIWRKRTHWPWHNFNRHSAWQCEALRKERDLRLSPSPSIFTYLASWRFHPPVLALCVGDILCFTTSGIPWLLRQCAEPDLNLSNYLEDHPTYPLSLVNKVKNLG